VARLLSLPVWVVAEVEHGGRAVDSKQYHVSFAFIVLLELSQMDIQCTLGRVYRRTGLGVRPPHLRPPCSSRPKEPFVAILSVVAE
jgi:hypothetical protein